mmetsp:Transcript_15896/g.23609  ORF Transcript_15896/g.23609 Transcript_15896/m.23609 type:complete len:158 (+) Transcript_15896:92-565(+)
MVVLNFRSSAIRFMEAFQKAPPTNKKLTSHSNRSKRGLFAGKDVRFGNSISFSDKKFRRKWLPNVQDKRLWSETLKEYVELKVTTTALREIDRAGGVDNYLLSFQNGKLVSSQGLGVKQRIFEALGDEASARALSVQTMLRRRAKGVENSESAEAET